MHLIVFVHGMWGRVADFDYITDSLHAKQYTEYKSSSKADSLALDRAKGLVYRCSTNEGYFTYDGVDVCGTRVANEVESVLHDLYTQEIKVDELSIVGFSMGALMIRYAVGLLEARKVFDQVTPKVLVVTCGPHIGVNILGPSLAARLFNFIGSWSMARTSRQAFLQDQPKPLFLAMTQRGSPWTLGLQKFKRRVLYANIANDRRCEFYTAAASPTNPFQFKDLRLLKGSFLPGYNNVVMDGSKPVEFEEIETRANPGGGWVMRGLNLGWQVVKVGVILPLWFTAFLINAAFQFSSSKFRTWRFEPENILFEEQIDKDYEELHHSIHPGPFQEELTPLMQKIAAQFNQCGWEKYYLRILNTKMAHAAAIMKHDKRSYDEGRPAVQHLIDVLLE